MAERNLAIRLAVIDGGKVKAELTEVGEKGERALKRIEAAARPASEGLKLVDRAANDAFAALGDATSRLGPLGTMLSRIGPAGLIAGGAIDGLTFGLSRLVFPVADVGEELNKLAQKTGVSVEALSALRYAADLSDVSSESLTKALRKLSVSLFDAKIGGEEGGAALKALGIRVTEVGGPIRATEEVLLDLAEKFAAMPDSAEKAAMAVRIFGRDGLAMIPMLNQGRDGLNAMMEEANRLGLVMSASAARAAEEFNDNLKRLHAVTEGVTRQLGSALLPVLADATEAMFLAKTQTGSFSNELLAISQNRTEVLGYLEAVAASLAFVAESATLAKRLIAQPFDSLSVVGKDVESWFKGDMLRSMKSMGYDAKQVDAEIAKLEHARDEFVRAANERLSNINQNPGYVDRVREFFDTQRRTVRVMGQKFVLETAEQAAAVQKIYDEFLPKWNRKRPIDIDESAFAKKPPAVPKDEGEAFLQQLRLRLTRQTDGEAAELRQRALELEKKGYAGVTVQAEKYIEVLDRIERAKEANKRFDEFEKEEIASRKLIENFIGANRLRQEELLLRRELLDLSEADRASLTSRTELEKAAAAARKQANEIQDAGLRSEAIETINAALARQLPIIEELARANVDYQRSFEFGARSALRTYVDDATNAAKQAERAVTGAFRSMEDALTQFVTTGRIDFNNLANSIISDLIRIQIQRMITLPLANWASSLGLFGGSGAAAGAALPTGASDLMGTMVNLAHTGGLLGFDLLSSRPINASVFDAAPRFHAGGLVGGEMPIIARQGEAVFTPGQMRALGGSLNTRPEVKIEVNVINRAQGVDARVEQQRQPDGSMRLDVIVEQIEGRMARSISQGTGLAPMLERRYGLNPAAGALR